MSRKELFQCAVLNHTKVNGQDLTEIIVPPYFILASSDGHAERAAFLAACEATGTTSLDTENTSTWDVQVVPF